MNSSSEEREQAQEMLAHTLLEENVARLMRRAYVPALPVPEFRARLVTLAREETQRHGRELQRLPNAGDSAAQREMSASRRLRPWILASLVAAVALFTVGLRNLLSIEPLRGLRSAAEIVRSGMVAVNWNDEDIWDALSIPQGNAVLDLGQGQRLKLSSPPDRAFFARLGLTLGAGSLSGVDGIQPAPIASRVVHARVFKDTSIRMDLQARKDDDNGLEEQAELRLELEHGGLRISDERGLLVSQANRVRFDTSEGTLEIESDAEGLMLRSGANSVSVVLLDGQGLPSGPSRTLQESNSVRVVDGHFVEDPSVLASDSSVGQRQAQTLSAQELDSEASRPVEPRLHVVSVTDGQTGAVIERVSLAFVPKALQNRVANTIKQDSEASDGLHVLGAVPQGHFKLVVFAEGYCLWTGPEQAFDPEADQRIDVTLTRGGSLRGYLVDPSTGNPVAGARVVPRGDLPAPTVPFNLDPNYLWLPILAVSKSDGSFELPHVSPGEHELQIAAVGFGTRFEKGIQIRADQNTDLEPIALDAEAVLAGTVSSKAGVPLQGAQVIVAPFDAGGEGLSLYSVTETDSEGHYSIGGLADSMFFAISIPDSSGGPPDVRPFRAVSGETARIDFGPATTGTVLDGVLRNAQGKALDEVNIALIHRSGGQPTAEDHFRASSTSSEGAYHFEGVSPGEYDLMVVGESNTICVAGTISVTGSLESQSLDLRLGGISATGRVLRAADNAPVAGIEIALLWFEPGQANPRFVADAKTNEDGTWRATGLRPGGFIAVCYPGSASATSAGELGLAVSQRVEGAEGQAEVDLGSTALFTGGSARIELKDDRDQPLVGMRVEIKTQTGILALPSPFSTTGAEGELVVHGLAPGTYTVNVFNENGAIRTSSLSVQAGMETLHVIELD